MSRESPPPHRDSQKNPTKSLLVIFHLHGVTKFSFLPSRITRKYELQRCIPRIYFVHITAAGEYKMPRLELM